MTDQTKVIIKKDREVRTYAELWHTSDYLLDKGKEQQEGSFHQFMASLVFTAFTLEAYLNHIGPKIFNCWRDLERLGPKEKLNVIAEKLGIAPDYSRRPWQVLSALFGFRNDIAHGKSVNISQEDVIALKDHDDHQFGLFIPTRWESYCTERNADRAREDIKEIVDTLHAATGIEDEHPFVTGIQISGGKVL